MPARSIKPTDKALTAYYAKLKEYSAQQVTHEGALETAFSTLLSDTARPHGWLLVPKLAFKRGGRTVIPDGTLRDDFNLHRGYWEAKDTDDDLSAEIGKKTAKGYPLTNTIFEDTRQAVLFQNGRTAFEADLHQPQQLADLLNAFYAHTEPDIEGFEQAVAEFQERVPDLALALADKIKAAHQDNQKFQAAFEAFFTLCQTALNPNISVAAVDEMLVQHLLTERLIRTIFDKDDFTRQNVIAAEVEKVIDALVSHSFSRKEFLKSLDRFYRAIEEAARNLEDFSEKQHFLNTVYERFFQGYSVKTADTHGIVYTPQQIVDFMCASVAEVLQTEFGKSLGDKDVHILDPCTGTGNFIVNLLQPHPEKALAADVPRAALRQRSDAPALLHCGPQHRARLSRADRPVRAVRGPVLCRYARPGREEAAVAGVHERAEHSARRAAEEIADHGHYRQSSLQRRPTGRQRQQQEPQVSGNRSADSRDICQGFSRDKRQQAQRPVCQVLSLGGRSPGKPRWHCVPCDEQQLCRPDRI